MAGGRLRAMQQSSLIRFFLLASRWQCRAAIARLETDVALVKATVSRLEAEIVEDRVERRRMREELDVLRLRVGDLDTRVKQLEARLPAR